MKSYIFPSIISVGLHGAAIVSGISLMSLPDVAVREAPSAIEIAIVGSQECMQTAPQLKEEKKQSALAEECAQEASCDIQKGSHLVPDMQQGYVVEENSEIGAQKDSCEAEILINVPPIYPHTARKRGEEGMVVLAIAIARDGRVNSVTIDRSSGSVLLDNAASRAVWKWQFVPAQQNGKNIPSCRKIPIVFKLK